MHRILDQIYIIKVCEVGQFLYDPMNIKLHECYHFFVLFALFMMR